MWWKAGAHNSGARGQLGKALVAGFALLIVPALFASFFVSEAGLAQRPGATSEAVEGTEAAPAGIVAVAGDSQNDSSLDSAGAVESSPAGVDEDNSRAGDPTPKTIDADREAAAGPQPAETVPVAEAVVPAPEPVTLVKRVGIQAGHWRSAELPDELAGLRTSTGTFGGGVSEWQLNLDIAKRVAPLLEAESVEVDVLPATIPPGYAADAFVALHADGDVSGRLSGFKLATPRTSAVADLDNALLAAITAEYQAATGLRLDHNITRNMTGYYAFGFRRFTHAITRTTPAVIVEMGFLTNASDRLTLLGRPDVVADGVARGVLRFLAERGQ